MTVPKIGLQFLLNLVRLAWNAGGVTRVSVFLYQQPVTVNANTTFADYNECTFNGYGQIAVISWGGPVLNFDNSYSLLSGTETWTYAGGAPQNVAGWGLVNAAGEIVASQDFTTGVVILNTPGQVIAFVPAYTERAVA